VAVADRGDLAASLTAALGSAAAKRES
jgi:hypothetical protein